MTFLLESFLVLAVVFIPTALRCSISNTYIHQNCIGIGVRHSICLASVTVDVSTLAQKVVTAGVSGDGQMWEGIAIHTLIRTKIRSKRKKEKRKKNKKNNGRGKSEADVRRTDR